MAISSLNLRYINKMDSLCAANDIEFRLKSPPLPSNMKKDVNRFSLASKKKVSDYFASITYYDSIHSSDGIHHKDALRYIAENKASLDHLIHKD